MEIGIFGGTFNPIHNGHLHLLEAAFQAIEFDRVLVIPTNIPPHKAAKGLAPNKDRLEMAKLALERMDRAWVSDIEQKAKGKSYTIHTLEKLRLLFPEEKFTLLLGADMLLTLDQWYRWQDILSMARVAAFARNPGEEGRLLEKAAALGKEVRIIYAQPLPLSSTEIREKLRKGEDVSGLVPEKVLAYIQERGLWR